MSPDPEESPRSAPTTAKPSLRIKGRSFVALVLMPESPVEDWLDALAMQMARSPTFFEGRPVIVDLSALTGLETRFEELIETLEKRDIRVIGVEGAAPGWTDSEVWGRPPIATNGRADRFVEIVDEKPEPPEATSLVLRGPIRSGQTVFFERGDVTVLGSVSSGAEVIAGGSVHVYGTFARPGDRGLHPGRFGRVLPQDGGRADRDQRRLQGGGRYVSAAAW